MNGFIALVVAVGTSLSTCAGHCPSGWVYYEGSCYLFSHEKKTFTEAEHFCLQHQAHLAKIESSAEDQFLNSFCSDLKDYSRWIGLSDADIEGRWKWTDGTSPDYINWRPGQPNEGKSANCLALFEPYGYTWTDDPCSATYMPICEKAEPGCESGVGSIVG